MVEKTADVAETAGKLVGAWDLVWAEQDRDGRKSEQYGKDPLGQIIYSANGRMAALQASVHWLEAGWRFLPALVTAHAMLEHMKWSARLYGIMSRYRTGLVPLRSF